MNFIERICFILSWIKDKLDSEEIWSKYRSEGDIDIDLFDKNHVLFNAIYFTLFNDITNTILYVVSIKYMRRIYINVFDTNVYQITI